jgi:hypothetical protein
LLRLVLVDVVVVVPVVVVDVAALVSAVIDVVDGVVKTDSKAAVTQNNLGFKPVFR